MSRRWSCSKHIQLFLIMKRDNMKQLWKDSYITHN